jgi:hypothetical protein
VSTRHAILVVEGPTDQAVIGRALEKLLAFRKFNGGLDDLPPFWRDEAKVVPSYPPRKGSLYERLPMPSILSDAVWSLAVYAGGGSKLKQQVGELIHNHDLHEKLDAFGIIVDADNDSPAKVTDSYRRAFQSWFPGLPDQPGHVASGPPATGVFVLPDNRRQGVVEHLVLECGLVVYPQHVARARQYVIGFGAEDRRRAKWSPFDEEKAIVASVGSLLKPGKTNTATIADNQWISEETAGCSMLSALVTFLQRLLGMSDGTVQTPVHAATPGSS